MYYQVGDHAYALTTGRFSGGTRHRCHRTVCGGPLEAKILPNNGDGTFTDPSSGTQLDEYLHLQASDVNHDGRVDLVADGTDQRIQVLLGNGDGTLQPPITSPSISAVPSDLLVRAPSGS
jgi:hypothetical protein